jgi:hypothetical protein
MSSDIEILNDECQEVDLEIRSNSIQIDVEDKMRDTFASITFNLTRKDHLRALRTLIMHLEHQLSLHDSQELIVPTSDEIASSEPQMTAPTRMEKISQFALVSSQDLRYDPLEVDEGWEPPK